MRAGVDRASRIAAVVAGAALLGMCLLVVVDVLARTVANRPLPGTLEYVAFWFMPTVVALSFGISQLRREQIEVVLLLDRLPALLRSRATQVVLVLVACTVGVVAAFAVGDAFHAASIGQTAGLGSPVPVWPFKFVTAVGLILLAAQCLVQLPDPVPPGGVDDVIVEKGEEIR